MTQFGPSFCCQLDGLKIASRILWANHELLCTPKSDRCPGLIAAKQAQIISCPPLCWQVVLSTNMLCLFCFFQHVHGCTLWPNSSTLVSSVQEMLWFVLMLLCKAKLCSHVLFREKRLTFLPTIQLSWTLAFDKLTEAYTVWDMAFVFLQFLWVLRGLTLG